MPGDGLDPATLRTIPAGGSIKRTMCSPADSGANILSIGAYCEQAFGYKLGIPLTHKYMARNEEIVDVGAERFQCARRHKETVSYAF